MVLDGLIPLYREIKRTNETYCVFKFQKNNVEFDIFFDINTNPFRLGFLVIGNNFQLWINVQQGFRITTNLEPSDYKRLMELLGLRYDPGNPFSTNSFFEEFNRSIPDTIQHYAKEDKHRLILYSHSIEEADKLYYDGLYEWDKLGSDKKRSSENLEKTRLLLPILYQQIKDRNVSVRYTAVESKVKLLEK